MSLESILMISSGFLTPLIAILAIYIAFKQYRIQRYKLRFDLYDRRFKIFERIKEFISKIGPKNRMESKEIGIFYTSIIEYRFLFDQDVNDFIDELVEKVEEFDIVCTDIVSYQKDTPEREKLEEQREKLRWWMMERLKELPDRFEKYLSFKRLK